MWLRVPPLKEVIQKKCAYFFYANKNLALSLASAWSFSLYSAGSSNEICLKKPKS